MAITRHTHTLQLSGPVYSPPPLNQLFGVIPFYWAIFAAGADWRVLESRRKQLVMAFFDYSWEQVHNAALDVFRAKKLKGDPTEAAFTAEVATWEIYHQQACQMAERK